MKINPTKQKVVDAATLLFFQKGFHGTSVRDIAERAMVNVSLISYYFNSKQGLLEYAVTNYYEMYLKTMETTLQENEDVDHLNKMKKVIFEMIDYKTEHFHLTSFINRELSLDSTFVREMTVTYLAKENHLLGELFQSILGSNLKRKRDYLFMQFKGMVMSPFILKNEWNNQLIDLQSRKNFIENYTGLIYNWLVFLSNSK